MIIGKKFSERLIVVKLWIALKGSPKHPESAADPEIAEQPLRAGCPACTTAAGFQVICGDAVNTCPMAARNPDRQPGSPPVVPEAALEPGQKPGFMLPWAAGIVPVATTLAKLALQATTWWRQTK